MKTIGVALIFLLLILTAPMWANAEEPPVLPEGFSLTFPMETGAVGFWFPETGAFAAGVSHTFMRVNHSDLESISLDLDATIAQEFSNSKEDDLNTLGGIGIKLNFDVLPSDKPGFAFLPSIGVTALNDFSKFKKAKDIFENYEIAVYGTVLIYTW